jgi:DNA gyrase/topoisomerase IV subunit A
MELFVRTLQTQLDNLKKQNAELNTKLKQEKEQNTELNTKLEQEKEQNTELNTKLNEQEKEYAVLKEQIQQRNNENQQLQAKVASLSSSEESGGNAHAEDPLKDQNQQLRDQIQQLRDQIQQLNNVNQQLNNENQQFRDGKQQWDEVLAKFRGVFVDKFCWDGESPLGLITLIGTTLVNQQEEGSVPFPKITELLPGEPGAQKELLQMLVKKNVKYEEELHILATLKWVNLMFQEFKTTDGKRIPNKMKVGDLKKVYEMLISHWRLPEDGEIPDFRTKKQCLNAIEAFRKDGGRFSFYEAWPCEEIDILIKGQVLGITFKQDPSLDSQCMKKLYPAQASSNIQFNQLPGVSSEEHQKSWETFAECIHNLRTKTADNKSLLNRVNDAMEFDNLPISALYPVFENIFSGEGGKDLFFILAKSTEATDVKKLHKTIIDNFFDGFDQYHPVGPDAFKIWLALKRWSSDKPDSSERTDQA